MNKIQELVESIQGSNLNEFYVDHGEDEKKEVKEYIVKFISYFKKNKQYKIITPDSKILSTQEFSFLDLRDKSDNKYYFKPRFSSYITGRISSFVGGKGKDPESVIEYLLATMTKLFPQQVLYVYLKSTIIEYWELWKKLKKISKKYRRTYGGERIRISEPPRTSQL